MTVTPKTKSILPNICFLIPLGFLDTLIYYIPPHYISRWRIIPYSPFVGISLRTLKITRSVDLSAKTKFTVAWSSACKGRLGRINIKWHPPGANTNLPFAGMQSFMFIAPAGQEQKPCNTS